MILSIVLTACSKETLEPSPLPMDEQINIDVVEDVVEEESNNEINPLDELTYEEDLQMKDILEYPIQLNLEKLENSVKLTWTKYNGDYEFASYKISRSVIDSIPYYPGHTLRKTISNIDELEYIDSLPEGGVSYYVVTALGPLNEKTHSNPVMVEFPNPKETPDQDIKLTATNTKDGVLLKWDKYNGDFLFYKVVWTVDHPNPKYPDDSTIATIAYVNQTEYLHTRAKTGMNYYAVTVVRPYKTKFTSERASVNIN